MKKAISLLLILTTILGCCTIFFACNDDPDDVGGVKALENVSSTVLDISTAGLSAGEKKGDEVTAVWNLKPRVNNATTRVLTLELPKMGLSDYREITFWMNNTSDHTFKFKFAFIMEDGSKVYAQTDLDNPYVQQTTSNAFYNPVTSVTVDMLNATPGWHQYSVPLDEVAPLSGQDRIEYVYDEKNKTAAVKFDKSKIVGFELDASADNLSDANGDYSITVNIGSIKANTNKYGTIKGFGITKMANAVCFYKESNFYLYNQHRYCLIDDEMAEVGNKNDSTYVPIAVLAEHRGATVTVNTKEKVTFTYNGDTYEFTEGQSLSYVGSVYSSNKGVEMTATASSIGTYVTVPMEVAATIFGYELYYNNGLAIFSDLPAITDEENYKAEDWENVTYVDQNSKNFYEDDLSDNVPGRQLGYVSQIVKVITFDYYTGADLLADMDAIHGENSHGNLVISNERMAQLKELVKTDANYKAWFTYFESTYEVGTGNYSRKLPYYHVPDGERMNSSPSEDILPYAFLYRMTGNEDYAKRVVRIMEALTKFKDPASDNKKSWHPDHYLDTATTMYYFAIGYDWCYDYIAEDSDTLKRIEDAAWEYGYGEAMGFGELFDYAKNLDWHGAKWPYAIESDGIFKAAKYNQCYVLGNWNAVCNNGLISIAFAFANVNSQYRAASEYLLTLIPNDTTYAMIGCYAPDGGHPEGPSYWAYGTEPQVAMFLTIKNCTGSFHGLNDIYGFEDSFDYILGIGSSTFGAWNYHDAGNSRLITHYLFPAAYMFGEPSLSQFKFSEIMNDGGTREIWDLMYYDPAICYENKDMELELNFISYKVGIATFRSDWGNNQMYTGLHGGANNAGHGQHDIGNFILEYNGTRFFVDLGKDSYTLADEYGNLYFSPSRRYWVYVNRAEGHNTLVINPSRVDKSNMSTGSGISASTPHIIDSYQRSSRYGFNFDQSHAAFSRIIDYRNGKTSAFAVVDMGSAYGFYEEDSKNDGKEALNIKSPTGKRGLLVTDNRSTVIIQDEMDISVFENETNTVLWMGHIVQGGTITISADKKSALISYNGHTLICQIVTPDGYEGDWYFESQAADYHPDTGLQITPGEYNRDGKQKLVAVGTVKNDVKLAVVCRLLSAGAYDYEWTDIEDWDKFIVD